MISIITTSTNRVVASTCWSIAADPADDSLNVLILPHTTPVAHTHHSSADDVVPHILSTHSGEPKHQVVQEVLTSVGPPSVQAPQLVDLPFGDEELLLDPLRGLL